MVIRDYIPTIYVSRGRFCVVFVMCNYPAGVGGVTNGFLTRRFCEAK
jgi:hypothetical protein